MSWPVGLLTVPARSVAILPLANQGWEVLIPSNAFKNANSSLFGSKPLRLVLPDLLDLYKYLNAYIERRRGVLLAGAEDPGTLSVKTVKTTSTDAALTRRRSTKLGASRSSAMGSTIPITVVARSKICYRTGRTTFATCLQPMLTGSYEQASYAIQDTPEMVANHYGRILPQDKAALAARFLNQVWEVAA